LCSAEFQTWDIFSFWHAQSQNNGTQEN
jgi:hypothetical protein